MIHHNPDTNYLKGIAQCINTEVQKGFSANFSVDETGHLTSEEKTFTPGEVKIVNFYRFEGYSDPSDNSILYVIETTDGTKGTLVDAYGAAADEHVGKFIRQVEEIHKRNVS